LLRLCKYNLPSLAFWLSQLTLLADYITETFFPGEVTFKAKGIPIHRLLLKRQQQRRTTQSEQQQQQQQQQQVTDELVTSRRFLDDVAFKALDFYRVLLNNTYQEVRSVLPTAILEVPSNTKKVKRARRNVFTFLNTTLKTLKSVYLYESIVNQFFYQLFYFIDCVLFNELMEHTERLSSTTHGFEIALALSTLLEWSDRHVPGLPRDQLFQHILQAANVMVMDKSLLTDKETLATVWPVLNVSHIYRLISCFSSDPTTPESILPDVKNFLRQLHEANPQEVKLDEQLFATLH
jgi:hypothetical protein